MTATTTTPTITTVSPNRRGRAAFAPVGRVARATGLVLAAIGSRWNDIVDAGQFGPSGETVTSRHTGSRI